MPMRLNKFLNIRLIRVEPYNTTPHLTNPHKTLTPLSKLNHSHIKTNMHQHPSCIRIPRRTLSVSHVLIIHIIAGKIKPIFEF